MIIQKLDMSIRCSHIMCSQQDDYVEIQIEDKKSGIQFLTIPLTMAEFGKFIKGAGETKVSAEVRGADCIGLRYVSERRSITVKKNLVPESNRKNWEKWLEEEYDEHGWQNSHYLGSQTSGQWNSDEVTLNFHVFKWVKEDTQ